MYEGKSNCNECSDYNCGKESQGSCHDQSHCHTRDEKIAEPRTCLADLKK